MQLVAEMWYHLVDPVDRCFLRDLLVNPMANIHCTIEILHLSATVTVLAHDPIPIRHHYLVDPAVGLLDFLRDLILAVVLAVPSCGTILDFAAVVHLERRR